MEKLIISKKQGAVLSLSLNRSDSYNALNPALLSALYLEIGKAEVDEEVKVVILKGNGKGFCAGQDLKMLKNAKEVEASAIIEKLYKPVITGISNSSKLYICQLHGVASGAGLALALSCDIVYAEKGAKLIPGFVKVGLMPDSGASWFLVQILGVRKAFELLALGEKIGAEEAHQLGLINHVTPPEKLETIVNAAARHFSQGPSLVFKMLKKLIKEIPGKSLEEVITFEGKFQDIAAKSEDFAEAVSAFLEKREPRFRGC